MGFQLHIPYLWILFWLSSTETSLSISFFLEALTSSLIDLNPNAFELLSAREFLLGLQVSTWSH